SAALRRENRSKSTLLGYVVLRGGWRGSGTTNGPCCTPRNPAPADGPPMATNGGRSLPPPASSSAVHAPSDGYAMVGLGTYPVCRSDCARSWLPSRLVMERTMASRCACSPRRGRCSDSSIAGARVAIFLNLLCALRSNVSVWLG